MSKSGADRRQPIVLAPGEGRAYPMGRISALVKADGPETESRYSVSGSVRAGITTPPTSRA